MNELRSKLAAPWGGFLCFVVLYFISVQTFSFGLNVYDYHRLLQIAFIALFCFSAMGCAWPAGFLGWSISCFFVAGLVSSIFSVQPFWGGLEWLRVLLLFALALVVARMNENCLRYVMTAVYIIAVLVCVKLFVGFLVVVRFGGGIGVLADGFSNHRHFAEFFIALGSFLSFCLFRRGMSWAAVGPLFVCWMVLLFGAGRASLLAFLAGFLVFFFIGGQGLRRGVFFGGSGVFAWLVYALVVELSPLLEGGQILRDGTSGRFFLWSSALVSWVDNVLLGIGPMHFAFYSKDIAAHPHNLFIQILVEWGGVSFLGVCGFFGGVLIRVYSRRGNLGGDFYSSFPVLIGLLASSMFGGVLVVPAVELVFFIFLGVVLRSANLDYSFVWSRWTLRILTVCLVLFVCVAWLWRGLDVPRGAVLDAPRFWQDGGIPLD